MSKIVVLQGCSSNIFLFRMNMVLYALSFHRGQGFAVDVSENQLQAKAR